MGRPRKWKPGDVGYLSESGLYGLRFASPVKVEVICVDQIGNHPVKVKDKNGDIYYCAAKELKARAAQSLKHPATMIVPEPIKKQAETKATERMNTIMEKIKGKPQFDEVAASFYQIERARQAGLEAVAQLAEQALYQEIKDGVSR